MIFKKRKVNKILEKYTDLGYLFIGSVGKKNDDDFNSDIDIAILCNNVNELEYMLNDIFSDLSIVTTESLYIVSIKYPYKYENKTKYVQCDFMVMWDIYYTSFRYWCPNYKENESKYKVGAKIMFANMILNHCDEKNKNLKNGYFGKFVFKPTALYRKIYNMNDLSFKEELYSINPKEIASYCFYDSDINHFNSVETLWDAIHNPKIFKNIEETKIIERNFFRNCFRKGWTSIIPESFKLEYNSIEDIYKIINEQKLINKINEIGQKGKEI